MKMTQTAKEDPSSKIQDLCVEISMSRFPWAKSWMGGNLEFKQDSRQYLYLKKYNFK